jgi:hypothetical protein
MVFSPVKTSGTNDVSFYIDDMNTSLLTTDSFSPYTGYNQIEIQEMYWPVPRTNALPYFAVWDDINVATMPGILFLNLSAYTDINTSPITATWDGVGADHYLVQVDSGAWTQQSSPYAIDTTGLSYGSHTFNVKKLHQALGGQRILHGRFLGLRC